MIDSIKDISNFSVLLSLMIFICSLLGMELFAYSVAIDLDGEMVYNQEEIQAMFESGQELIWPRENFNNIGNAMTTIFIAIIGEDWQNIMYLYSRVQKKGGEKMATTA